MSIVTMRRFLWAAAISGTAILPALGGPAAQTASLPAPAAAAPSPTLDVAYDMRYWFIPFGHTTYHGVFHDGTYQVSSYFKTSGLVSVFWQAEIDAGSSGRVEPHDVKPYIYDSYYRRGSEKKQRVKLTYRPDAPPELLAVPKYNTAKYPVSAKEQEEGVDPMSAVTLIFSGVKADAENPCGTVAPVFDGRRRYDIEFTYVKDERVKLDNGVYNGPVHLCRLHYKQIAGYKPKMMKEGAAWPPIFADIADIPAEGAPDGRFLVPVKLWADTGWGRVTAELSHLKAGEAGDNGGPKSAPDGRS